MLGFFRPIGYSPMLLLQGCTHCGPPGIPKIPGFCCGILQPAATYSLNRTMSHLILPDGYEHSGALIAGVTVSASIRGVTK
jgi:hypothetical protein